MRSPKNIPQSYRHFGRKTLNLELCVCRLSLWLCAMRCVCKFGFGAVPGAARVRVCGIPCSGAWSVAPPHTGLPGTAGKPNLHTLWRDGGMAFRAVRFSVWRVPLVEQGQNKRHHLWRCLGGGGMPPAGEWGRAQKTSLHQFRSLSVRPRAAAMLLRVATVCGSLPLKRSWTVEQE